MPRIPSRPPLDLSGKWAIVELSSMMDDYLDITPDPHVLITHTEFERFTGTYHFAAQNGEITGRVDEVFTDAAALFFTFVGSDEGDEVNGAAADVAYHAGSDTITGTMRYHQGDDMPFVWERIPVTKPKAVSAKKRK